MENFGALYTRTAPDRDDINVATQEGANAYLRQMQKDGKPPFSSYLLVNINKAIHEPQENAEKHRRLQREVGKSILQCFYMMMRSIFIHASNDLLREVVSETELRIILNHFVSLMKYTISRRNKGAFIDEASVHEAMLLMSNVLDLNSSYDITEDFLKSLVGTAKSATTVPSQDSGVGYYLCHAMMECFYHGLIKHGTKTTTIERKYMMMHKTGMLEQVLRHVHLPWTQTTNYEMLGQIRFIFITIASSTFSLSKMFKAGSPSRDALVDILEGRIKPCPENEHIMEILEALKKFIDMGLTSGNPDGYITKHKICRKCEKVDPTRKILVCAKCKEYQYCSRECQVADWKDHKKICKIISSALGSKSEKFQAIAAKFTIEHKNSIYEAVTKCYDGNDLVLDLDFSNDSSPKLPPAFRNPPEFEIFPADIFWNREKEKAPGHWFFKDMSGGEPYYTDEKIKNMKKVLDSRNGASLFTLYVFLKFSDTPHMVTMHIPKMTMEDKYLYNGKSKNSVDQLLSENLKDLSVSEKEKVFKMCTEMIRKDMWDKVFS